MLSKIKIKFFWKDAVYPVIVAFAIIVIAILFAISTGSLAKNINKALEGGTSVTEGNSSEIDLQDFYVIAKKLGIEVKDKSGSLPAKGAPLQTVAPE